MEGFADQIEEINCKEEQKKDLEGVALYMTGELEVVGGACDPKFNLLAKGQPIM